MINYTFEEFLKDIEDLNIQKPDAIVAIARGGLTIAHFLAEKFDLREVFVINSISYEKDKKLEKIKVFNIPKLDKFKKVLVVDDISDSGETLSKVTKILKEKYPSIDFKTFTIFYKENTKFMPDFTIKKTDEWVKFFWEKN